MFTAVKGNLILSGSNQETQVAIMTAILKVAQDERQPVRIQ